MKLPTARPPEMSSSATWADYLDHGAPELVSAVGRGTVSVSAAAAVAELDKKPSADQR